MLLPEYHSNEHNKERHNYLLRITKPLKGNRDKFRLSHLAKKKKAFSHIFFYSLSRLIQNKLSAITLSPPNDVAMT